MRRLLWQFCHKRGNATSGAFSTKTKGFYWELVLQMSDGKISFCVIPYKCEGALRRPSMNPLSRMSSWASAKDLRTIDSKKILRRFAPQNDMDGGFPEKSKISDRVPSHVILSVSEGSSQYRWQKDSSSLCSSEWHGWGFPEKSKISDRVPSHVILSVRNVV